MATSRDNLFNKLSGSFWNAGVTFERTNPVPLEKYSVFQTKAEADSYALTNVVAYPGQPIAVVGETGTELYYIDNDGTLKALATGGDASALEEKLNVEISARKDNDLYLSSEISTINTTTLPKLSGDINTHLSTTLSVTVEKLETAETGYEATYVVKQGGVQVGSNINIPKDKVVDSADVVVFKTDEEAVEKTSGKVTKAGTYIKITFENKDEVYVDVPELANVYKGGKTSTINVTVSSDQATGQYGISADILQGSVSETMLCSDFTTKVATVIGREGQDRSVIETLSGDENTDGSVKKALKDAKAYTDEKVLALSNSLSADVKDLSSSLSETITLSVGSLESEIDATKTSAHEDVVALSNEVVQDIAAEATARADGDEALSNEIKALSTSLSDEVDAKVSGLKDSLSATVDKRVLALSTSLSNEVDAKVLALNTSLSTTVDKKTLDLSTSLSNDIKDLSTSLSSEVDAKVKNITDNYVTNASLNSISTAVGLDTVLAASGKVAISSDVTSLVDTKIKGLTGTVIGTLSVANTITSLIEIDGKVSAVVGAISIAHTQVNDWKSAVEDVYETKSDATSKKEALEASDAFISGKVDTLSNEVSAISSKLEGEIAAAVSESAKAINDLSVTISTDLSGEIERAEAAEAAAQAAGEISAQAVRDDLSGYVQYADVKGGKTAITDSNKIVTQSDIAALTGVMHFRGVTTDENVVDEYTGKPSDIDYYKNNDPTQGDFILRTNNAKEFVFSGTYGSDGKWYEVGDEDLYAKKTELETEEGARKANDTYLSNQITSEASLRASEDLYLSGQISSNLTSYNTWKNSVELSTSNLSAYASGLSTDLGAEATRRAADDSVISGVVDNKVKVGDYKNGTYTLANQTSLSVVKLSDVDYHQMVADGTADPNVMYIVSSDNINAFDQRIINVGTPTDDTDAVNLSSMTAAIATAKSEIQSTALTSVVINSITADVASNVASFSISCIDCGGANA